MSGQRAYTGIVFETENGTYAARIERIEVPLEDVVDDLIIPVLRAAGYSEDTIRKFIDFF